MPPAPSEDNNAFRLRVLSSLQEINSADWDAVANPDVHAQNRRIESSCEATDSTREPDESTSEVLPDNPFISHAFLSALEETGCADFETGWIPRHLILESEAGEVLGAVPAYLKTHSQGEYVFDYGWAEAFYRAGGDYYPKLQISVPFTPATGRRFLLGPKINQRAGIAALASGLTEICRRSEASSVHITFLTEGESAELDGLGFLKRTDQQFHWQNRGYGSFDNFLEDLSSRKRKAIRKERRDALKNDISVEWVTGKDLQEHHWDAFFEFYTDTGSRKWGSPYLTREFFSLIGERMADQILLVMARRGGRYIAGALNFIGANTLFGRNWGCTEHHPFLHFELCYYQAIEFAIRHGIDRVEAGAQGAHKLARGYMPETTYSAHWIAHKGLSNAVADFLDHERHAVEREQATLREHAPFRKQAAPQQD